MFFNSGKSKMTANGIDMLVKNGKKEAQALLDDLRGFDSIENQLGELAKLAQQNQDTASSTLLTMIKINMDEKQNNMKNKIERLKETLEDIDNETDRLQ